MNNLQRELAPISDAAWSQIEEEASRTLKRYLAGRRVVDVQGPGGVALSAVGTGHLRNVEAPGDGILARQREVNALVELRVAFDVDRHRSMTWNVAPTTRTGSPRRMPRDGWPLLKIGPSSMAIRLPVSEASARGPAIRWRLFQPTCEITPMPSLKR